MGPGKSLVGGVTGLINQFVASPEQKLAAQQALLELEANYQKEAMAADISFAQSQAEVIKSEADSQSWMARNWRPVLMLVFTYIIFQDYVVAPLFSLKSLVIPPDMWQLLKLGIGGYIAGRSAEKITAPIVSAVLDSKKK